MFLHRKTNEQAIYIQLTTSIGSSIKLTAYHLIYTSKCQLYERLKLVRAADVKIGDCIHVVKGPALHSTRVTSIDEVCFFRFFWRSKILNYIQLNNHFID